MQQRGSLRDAIRRDKARHAAKNDPRAAGNTRALRLARKSGQLNLSSRELRAFPEDIFHIYELVEEGENSWECATLQKIDLSYNEIGELPDEVESLKYLQSFKMRHNCLRTLPEPFWDLTTLTALDLSNNELEGCLPDKLGKLDKLRELGLEGNKLTALPESLAFLTRLEVLRVEANQLTALPSDIGKLKSLKTLSAHSNRISELPTSFRSLTGLVTLDLKKNALQSTADAFVALTSLKYLDLRQNRLEVFPTLPENNTCLDSLFLGFNALHQIPEDVVLGVKESLTVLDVRDNKLQGLPERFPQLYRLKTLDVTNNDLHDLPAGLGYLKYLNHLLVEGNPLRSIRRSIIASGTEPLKKYLRTRGGPPEGVDVLEEEVDEFALQLQKMSQDKAMNAPANDNNVSNNSLEDEYLFREAAASGNLQLVDMKLQKLPDCIQGAGKYRFADMLQQLNVSKNWLVDLPACVGELTSLHTLIAEHCGLKSVHPSIAMIPNLQHLRLRHNHLTSDAINDLLSAGDRASICFTLKELDLRNNVLVDMPQKLQVLETVDTMLLSFNRLRVLDSFAWAKMRQLSVLSLSDNRLESLGKVHEAAKLTSLSLENNELRQIPAELALCQNLRALYLNGNPQRGIRMHILNSGTDAVLKHLRNKLPPDMLPPTIQQKDSAQSQPQQEPSPMDTDNSEKVAPNPNEDAVHRREAPKPLEPKRLRVNDSTSPFKPMQRTPTPQLGNPRTPVRGQAAGFESAASPFATQLTPASSAPPTPVATGDEVLAELETKISKLETQLDDFAITAAKRFALKKDLAMARSLKIRHLRKLQQKP